MRSRFRVIAFLIAMFALLGCSYAFVRVSETSRRQALEADMLAKRQAIAEFRESAAGVEAVELQMDGVRKSIAEFQRRLPSQDQVNEIVSSLSRLAAANSLAMQSIKTLEPVRLANIGEQSVELTLEGDFNGVYALLLQIEKLPRLTRVSKLKIEKADEHDPAVRATMTLGIFFEPANRAVAMGDKEQP